MLPCFSWSQVDPPKPAVLVRATLLPKPRGAARAARQHGQRGCCSPGSPDSHICHALDCKRLNKSIYLGFKILLCKVPGLVCGHQEKEAAWDRALGGLFRPLLWAEWPHTKFLSPLTTGAREQLPSTRFGFVWKAAPYRCASRACSGAGQPSQRPCSTLLPGEFTLQPLTLSMDESGSSSASLGAPLRVWNTVRWEEERLKVLKKTLATGGNWDGPRGLLGWTKRLLKD